MTWLRRRRPAQAETAETVAAREQLKTAHQELAAARADDDPVDQVAAKLRKLRNRNHFGPMITQALRGSR